MNFGQAIEALKEGKKVARKGWNGKRMYLRINKGGRLLGEYVTQDYIYMKTVQHTIVPWLASQTDMLAEDWEVVE